MSARNRLNITSQLKDDNLNILTDASVYFQSTICLPFPSDPEGIPSWPVEEDTSRTTRLIQIPMPIIQTKITEMKAMTMMDIGQVPLLSEIY